MLTSTRTRAMALVVVLIAFFGATACTPGSSPSGPNSSSAAPTGGVATGGARSGAKPAPVQVDGTRSLAGNERSFGPSVGNIPGAVYQPDVVLIGGGADAIVGALDDGLVWTIKGSAPGANELVTGKIMVATTFATGRVEQVQHVGDDVQVVLAPVALTDVFKKLDISSSSPVSLQQPLAYSYGHSPLTSTAGDSGTNALPPSTAPTVAPSAPPEAHFLDPLALTRAIPPGPISVPSAVPTVSLPEPDLKPKPVHQGKFSLTPYCCYPSQGVHIEYNEPTGRMEATVGLVMGAKPAVDFHIVIDLGGLEEAVFELNGPKAIEFQFKAATKDVSGNYQSPTLRVPIAFTFPIAGIPFTVELTQSVSASIQLAGQAAFSSTGEYAISGGLGFAYRNGKFGASTPHFSSHISSLENAASFSVGINALSIKYGAHLSIGIGVLGFNGGPYVDLTAKLAIDKDGSPPQTSLTAGCATAAVYVGASFGVGYTIPRSLAKVINSFLSLFNASPIPPTGGRSWGPFTLWNPGSGQRCLQRPKP